MQPLWRFDTIKWKTKYKIDSLVSAILEIDKNHLECLENVLETCAVCAQQLAPFISVEFQCKRWEIYCKIQITNTIGNVKQWIFMK